MKLYHSSEEDDIQFFDPRIPTAVHLGNSKAVVWAVSEDRLYNYLLPRDCPRISFFKTVTTSEMDITKFMLEEHNKAVILLEQHWLKTIQKTTLYLYELNPAHFYLYDDNAGYYLSEHREYPLSIQTITDMLARLFQEQVEIRFVQRLNDYVEKVLDSSLGFSMIRMRNAKP